MRILILTCAALLWFCSQNEPAPSKVIDSGDGNTDKKITLVDRTGKVWDLTHAVKVYGFSLDLFRFGLGVNAIPPILHPQFAKPGQSSYPAVDATFEVIGLTLNGLSRAYPLNILRNHEVVNDRFLDRYVAVAY